MLFYCPHRLGWNLEGEAGRSVLPVDRRPHGDEGSGVSSPPIPPWDPAFLPVGPPPG